MSKKYIDYDNILLYYFNHNEKTGRPNAHYDGQFTLRQFLNCEKGNDSYVGIIEELRSKEYHSNEYNALKKKLPLFWIFGKSMSGFRRKNDVTTSYNIFSIDIDKQDNTELFGKYGIETIKRELFYSIDSCFCAMLSAGGQGIVLYLLLDDVNIHNEKMYFDYWVDAFKKNGLNIDTQTNDIISRARYISYDENILIKDEVEPFSIPEGFRLASIREEDRNLKDDANVVLNTVRDIQYLDSTRRYQYVHTLMTIYTPEKAVELTKKIYDFYYNGTSDKKEAYDHIEASAKQNKKRKYDNIWRELQLLGIVEDSEQNEFRLDINLKQGEEGNQWLYDRKDDILSFLKPGINMMVAGTGNGKTEFWNQIADRNEGDIWNPYKEGRDVCVVEPFNSVVDGKYDKTKTDIAAGEGKFIKNGSHYTATNYAKFVKWVNDGNFSKFDYLVIDESHMIGTETYRAEDMVEFVNAVKKYTEKYPDAVVVLQTATPSNEDWFFDDICCEIHVHKDTNKKVSIHYTINRVYKGIDKNTGDEIYENSIIDTIKYYAKQYIEEGRKVYIYWGDGSINNMKNYQKAEDMLGNFKAAIYHKKNEGNEDLEYIKSNRMMGSYDILMTSCYFSVGCDLNDDCKAAVIIIGNNTYQQDEQVIGRFRKSKDIIVNIILDKCSIPKIDVSKLLESEEYNAKALNNSKAARGHSIIRRYSKDSNLKQVAYIKCSKYYFSDIARKFNFYKEMKYKILNNYEICINEEDNLLTYDITEQYDGKNITVVQIIKDVDEVIKKAIKQNRKEQNTTIENIYSILIDKDNIDIDSYIHSSKSQPKLNEWLKAIKTLKNHYDLPHMLNKIPKKTMLKLSKKKLNTLLSWKTKMEKNEDDKVESQLINMICKRYDEINDKNDIRIYIAVAYCYWCMYNHENIDSTYDLAGRLSFPVYKEWRSRVMDIVKVDKDVRNYIVNYKEKHGDIVFDETYEFLKDILTLEPDNTKEAYDIFKNKFIHSSYYSRFLDLQVRQIIKGMVERTGQKEIKVRGMIFGSVEEAIKELNVSKRTIYREMIR